MVCSYLNNLEQGQTETAHAIRELISKPLSPMIAILDKASRCPCQLFEWPKKNLCNQPHEDGTAGPACYGIFSPLLES